MKILALEKEPPDVSPNAFKHFAEEEARKTWELHQAGMIRELYFRADQTTAVFILECDSIEKAQNTLAELPFVRKGLIVFDLIPLKAYPGFERLFRQ